MTESVADGVHADPAPEVKGFGQQLSSDLSRNIADVDRKSVAGRVRCGQWHTVAVVEGFDGPQSLVYGGLPTDLSDQGEIQVQCPDERCGDGKFYLLSMPLLRGRVRDRDSRVVDVRLTEVARLHPDQ